MSRKNKTLRAFLHQNENPTIEQAWDHAWKHAQKEFHARSMQEMEATIDRLIEALRTAEMALRWYKEGDQVAQARKIDELLSEIEAEKGGHP